MILIIGATGNVGGHLARQADASGHEVRILVRDPQRAQHLPGRIDRVVGDLTQPETLAPAFDGIRRMFLMETGAGSQHTANAVTAALRAGVEHIVSLSSIGVVIDPMPIMGTWHHTREQIILRSGLAWTFLRPSSFMTNTLQWVRSIQTAGAVYDPIGPGRQALIDPVDVAAVAAVALTVERHAGRSYVLTGSELLTMKEQIEILAGVLGRPIRHIEQTPEEAAQVMAGQGMPDHFVEAVRDLNELFRADRSAVLTDDVERLTGRPPATFESWCRRHASAFAPEPVASPR
jgi:uncharacterized protein YbjT (DUF2867 family)